MAIENAKMLNVRIKNKYDSYENWASSGLVLEAGEIAIAHTTVDVKVDNGTVKHPALLMKVGDGEKTFANLPWLSAKAADVLDACKSTEALTTFVNSVIADAGIATNEAMQALAGRVTTAEGKITTLEGQMTTAEGKIATAEQAITVLEGLTGGKKVSDAIAEAIAALNLADTYAAKSVEKTVSDHIADTVAHVTTADKTKWNAALQASDIAAGAINGTIAVKGTDVAVTGLGSAAFTEATAYDAAGAAATAEANAKAYAKEYADGLAGNYDEKGAAAAAETAAKAYADGLAGNYDAAGAASAAEAAAKKHADDELARLVGTDTVSAQISTAITNLDLDNKYDAKGAAAAAETAAKGHADGLNTAMNARVEALEAIDHEHANATELAKIADGDVAKWNAAEQNAKDYADDLDEAMDLRMQAVEAKLGTGEGGVDAQIAAAVAAEAALREAADADLQEQVTANADAIEDLEGELERLTGGEVVSEAIAAAVKEEADRAKGIEGGLETRLAAVEGDYLKAADKEALQTQINTIMSNPDAEGAINSINEFTQYVKDHGTIADGMRTDINKNKDDIAAEVERAGEAEAELEGAINGVADELKDVRNTILTLAPADEVVQIANRVNTIEGDLNTAETGLKARATAAEGRLDALEGLTGGKKVSDAIAEAIEALKIGDYAKAADLTAAIEQHAADKAELEGKIALKANDTDLAAIAKTGSTDDLVQGTMTLVFDCGTSAN